MTIAENERPEAGTRLGWRVGAEPAVSIGAVEGDPAYELFQVVDATRLPDGRIVVANSGSGELRSFDASGIHLRSWGGQGEGPGEFGRFAPSSVGVLPGDSIIAADWSLRRLSVFDSDGEHGRTFRLPDPYQRLAGILPDGKLFVASSAGFTYVDGEFPDGLSRRSLEYGITEPDGSAPLTLGARPGGDWASAAEDMSVRQHPFSRAPVYAAWGHLVVMGANDRYEIRAYAADGALARIVRREHELRQPTRAELDAYFARRYERLPEDDRPAALAEVADMPLTDAYPAFGDIVVDEVDHLWVAEYGQTGETGPVWTVFDPAGRVLGFVETPPGLWIFEIGADYILASSFDELGVQGVQVWPLDRATPPPDDPLARSPSMADYCQERPVIHYWQRSARNERTPSSTGWSNSQ